MEDGEEMPIGPRRPQIELLLPSEEGAKSESYGYEYYSMNREQKLSRSKPDRDRVSLPKTRGGWTFVVLLAVVALYFYLNPSVVPAFFGQWKEWVLAQQRDIFSSGGGYGVLPQRNP